LHQLAKEAGIASKAEAVSSKNLSPENTREAK